MSEPEILPVNKHASTWPEVNAIVKTINVETSEFIYLIRLSDGLIKVGRTNNLLNRMGSYLATGEESLELLYIIKTKHAFEMEKHILENIKLTPKRGREYFQATNEDIDNIIKITRTFKECDQAKTLISPVGDTTDDFSIAFVATVDSKGRLRIPKKQRDAKRIVAGMDFEVKIWQIEKEKQA